MPAMQQIAEWLETLGLSEYARCFADNDIDTSVLRHLTDQDLKELGVSLGHRRKMLAAIAEMGNSFVAQAPARSDNRDKFHIFALRNVKNQKGSCVVWRDIYPGNKHAGSGPSIFS
jgi:hypothetical protein